MTIDRYPLVPKAGRVYFGAAAGGFTDVPADKAVKTWEKAVGRTAQLFHVYHVGDQVWPTNAEKAMVRDPKKPRILVANWKVAYKTNWAAVARGQMDYRIEALAKRLRYDFHEPFFLVLHHEPENDVNPKVGSGMTAADFANMFRHVVQVLRRLGIHNAIPVVAYMSIEKWFNEPWWHDLYPGNDVVDWIGYDAYINAKPGAYHYGDFASMLDRGGDALPQGFYRWAAETHPWKPLMIAEFGIYRGLKAKDDRLSVFRTVLPELKQRDQIKALVFFDTPQDKKDDREISVLKDKGALQGIRELAADPIFDVK